MLQSKAACMESPPMPTDPMTLDQVLSEVDARAVVEAGGAESR